MEIMRKLLKIYCKILESFGNFEDVLKSLEIYTSAGKEQIAGQIIIFAGQINSFKMSWVLSRSSKF